MDLKQILSNNLKNIIGKSVKEKYIIFESDDWGSIRMPSLQALNNLKQSNISLDSKDNKRYTHNDTLATKKDFEMLFDTLSKFKDNTGNSPVFTAVSVVANPDFDKIKENNYTKYEYEPFTTTLERYGQRDAFSMWQQGVQENLFYPEFHGREHLNTALWMRALQADDKVTKLAFNEKTWAVKSDFTGNLYYEAAFDVDKPEDIVEQQTVIKEGLQLFEQLHGYKAKFIVPPNGPFNNRLEEVCADYGIQYIGAAKVQNQPLGNNAYKKTYHWLGQKNKYGQVYLTRNSLFEPNKPDKSVNLEGCLKNIHYAFKWNKPAVISSHRTNYTSSLNTNNRNKSLKQLDLLLTEILKKWPEVRFITSTKLGELLSND